MTARRGHGTLIVTALALVLLVGAGTAAVLAHMSSGATKLTVTETEFHLKLSKASLKPGKYTIDVVNHGHIAHSLAISGPGLKTRLPSTLAPGKSGTLKVTLKAGSYTLWCPVPGHAARGMRTRLAVAGGAAKSSGSTTTTSHSAWG